jgi:hypothetical protein
MTLTRGALFACGILALAPVVAQAQVEGLQVSAGVTLLTKAGAIGVGPGALASDLGFAARGRVRYGFGLLSVAGDVQSSSQDYGADVKALAPWKLSATYVGATGAVHPLRLAGVMPYAELGIGSLAFSDEQLKGKGGVVATLGLGAQVSVAPRLALDVSLRVMRKSFRPSGLSSEIKYDPKLFSVMATLSL